MERRIGGPKMRTFATLSIAGVTGIALLKLLIAVIFPLMAMFFGLIAMTVKFAVIAAVAYFVYSIFRRRCNEREHEIEVEVS